MSLIGSPRFPLSSPVPTAQALHSVLSAHRAWLQDGGWVYCGYTPLDCPTDVSPPRLDVTEPVDGMFRLGPACGFESVKAVVTCGLRASRFAPILFWEVLHALSVGGVWIDLDVESSCHGTVLTTRDFLEREYFAGCLTMRSREVLSSDRLTMWRKTSPSAIAAGVDDHGWTFGILTAGPSPRAAQMARAILALNLPAVEVIFCGPRPANAPDDPRVRAIDLELPEPRGWITRKKNLLAAAARHENLCLLHDRYVVTPDWAEALTDYGRCYSYVTFPHVYYAGEGRRFPQRYPDYQVLVQRRGLDLAMRSHVYDTNEILHPDYDDFSETSYCCGGLYVARRTLWRMLPQNEALYHCEYEDVSYGLECQRRGIPHRVSTLLTVESATPHPMMLVRKHTLRAGEAPALVEVHIGKEELAARLASPWLSYPAVPMDRAQYYRRVCQRFNAIPGLLPHEQLPLALLERSHKLSDFWDAIARHVATVPFVSRDRIAHLTYFMSDTIFRFSTPQVLQWIRDHERAVAAKDPLAGCDTVVGWGTGAAFRTAHAGLGRPLSFVIDRDAAKWGTVVDGVTVRGPSALRDLDPARSAVVVFSCYFDDIKRAAMAEGATRVIAASDACAHLPFRPLSNFVGYFAEVEKYYPNLFADTVRRAVA